jgi:purine catabolism regulator
VTDAALRAAWDAVTRRLPDAPAHMSVPVNLGRGRTWGTLSALGLGSPLRPSDRVVLERGASVVALAMLGRDGEQGLAARQRGDFISRLMDAAAPTGEREAAAMASDFGFDRRALLSLPIVAVRAHGRSLRADGSNETLWPTVWREVTRELSGMRIPAVTGVLPGEDGLGVVVALKAVSARSPVASRVSHTVRKAVARAVEDAQLIVCVGPVSRSWGEVGAAMRDALEMSHAVGHRPPREWLDSTTPDLDWLLWSLRSEKTLRVFVQRRLDPIVRHDLEHRTQLLHTLEAYCVHAGRVADTARELHLQRQSLYKRLGRIEELIEADLGDADTRLGLHFALRARRYLDTIESGGGA